MLYFAKAKVKTKMNGRNKRKGMKGEERSDNYVIEKHMRKERRINIEDMTEGLFLSLFLKSFNV